MRIATYSRVSTSEQSSEGASLAAQAAAIDAAALARGWEIVARFEDVGSGKTMAHRPGIAAAIEAVESGQADALVAARLDRLSRSVVDFAGLLERARRNSWHVVALDLGVDSSSPAGQLVAHVLSAVAQWERAAIAERTRVALAEKRRQGVVLGRPRLVAAETVERIHLLRNTGKMYAEIAAELNRDGIHTPTRRGRWFPASVRRIAAWDQAA